MQPPAESSPSVLPRWLAPVLCTLAGLGWSVYIIGLEPLLPGSIEWMVQDDWAQPLFGWLYSRTSPWSLPMGDSSGYLYPLGTSLAYMDATPWWSTLFKPLSPLLPLTFQIHGPWLALCFSLQGLFGALLVSRLSPRPLHQVLGGMLFVMSPALAMRLGHLSLCAHWLVLASLWLHLRPLPDARAASRTLGLAAFFVVLAAGVHVYLATMALALALGLVLRLWRVQGLLSGARAGAWAAGLSGSALGVMALFGYFSRATTSASGFNHYSSNLLTFINQGGMSRFLPEIPTGGGQYEGAAYLGLGVLLVGFASLGVLLAKREHFGPLLPPGLWPLLTVCGLMALFAFSARFQFAGWTVLSFQRASEVVLAPLARVFRSSGRFIWPLHYLLILGAIAGLLRVLRNRPAWAAAALGLAVVLQGAEVPAQDCCRARFTPHVRPVPGGDATWALAKGTYQHLALYPATRVDGAGRGCPGLFTNSELLPYAWQAWLNGMTFNSGYVARLDAPATLATCEREEADVQAGRLSPDTLYVVHAQVAESFLASTAGHAACGRVDGVLVCVSSEVQGPFREALAREPVTADVARDTP
ncbi:hypothetical protein JRI60_03990 [Archangium violaceum]|uniref:DUF6311 domain-containing protein n=1 Tax=Archangium violaceum TaxID=83451 RepID=UPI0019520C76|nr:DUF6311 domain-containing protein [Archangium violaceum]QRN98240.1 hypothetical protein JRI60_03990 [Archangium violaceum]